MPNRIRLALLLLVLVAFLAARAGGARAGAVGGEPHARRPPAAASDEAKIVGYARRLLGVRYSYGGSSPGSGFDCSGFTRFVYAHFGVSLPHYSGAQFGMGRRVSRWGLRPGDLLFFAALGHVGIYIRSGRFTHPPHSGTRVSIASIGGWYAGRFDGARRFLR